MLIIQYSSFSGSAMKISPRDLNVGRDAITRAVSAQTGLAHYHVKEIWNAAWKEIIRQILQGNKVTIYGLGQFRLVYSQARDRKYSPFEDKFVVVPKHKKLKFKPSRAFAKMLRNSTEAPDENFGE